MTQTVTVHCLEAAEMLYKAAYAVYSTKGHYRDRLLSAIALHVAIPRRRRRLPRDRLAPPSTFALSLHACLPSGPPSVCASAPSPVVAGRYVRDMRKTLRHLNQRLSHAERAALQD